MKYLFALFLVFMALKAIFRVTGSHSKPSTETSATPQDIRQKLAGDTPRNSKELFSYAEILLDGMDEDDTPQEQETTIKDACDLYTRALNSSKSDGAMPAFEIMHGWATSLGYALMDVSDEQVLAMGLGHMNRLYTQLLKEQPDHVEFLAEWGETLLTIGTGREGYWRYKLFDEAYNKFSMGAAYRPSPPAPQRQYEVLTLIALNIDTAVEDLLIETEADVPWRLRFLHLAQACYERLPHDSLDDSDKETLATIKKERERLQAEYPHMAEATPTVPQQSHQPSSTGWAQLEKKSAPGTQATAQPSHEKARAASPAQEKSAAPRTEQKPPIPQQERRQSVAWPPAPSEQNTPASTTRRSTETAVEQTTAPAGTPHPLAQAEPLSQQRSTPPATAEAAPADTAAYSRMTLPTHLINGHHETTTYPQRQARADRPPMNLPAATLSASASTNPKAMAPAENQDTTMPSAPPQASVPHSPAATPDQQGTAPRTSGTAPASPAPAAPPRHHTLRQPDYARREEPAQEQSAPSRPRPSTPASYVPIERKPLPRQ